MSSPGPSVAAIVVAAGRGIRVGGGMPKQYRRIGGQPVLARTLDALGAHPGIGRLQVVIAADAAEFYRDCLADLLPETRTKLLPPVEGGAARQDSVRAGLEALAALAPPDIVLVHDAARPHVDLDLIDRAIAAGRDHGAAVPGVPVSDTIKRVEAQAPGIGRVRETPAREHLRAVQTPQAFAFYALLDAHRAAAAENRHGFTDDGALAEWAGLTVVVFDGDPCNRKITQAADLIDADRAFAGREREPAMTATVTRLGTGFDVHAFTEGDHVWLGGVKIPAERGVLAHSDGDVALHALTDALLGAIADGDIGTHFPPSDPQWRGASSDRFLAHACKLVRARGGRIDHLDVTVLAESPRIGPHREAIRARIAEICGVPLTAVSIKATTTEKLGFVGRAEGLAAQAAATVRLPEEPEAPVDDQAETAMRRS
ncbi:bifunctional 2-C-methyl-D-erythritol 4-phosphate cytidylyltransferase/2-C-methyl-D-erythritol 2,4-cyclodiphosphate synthase [uncultured Methylobacterium sp.]|uniref:bifunctional 2-C-methyl-D-erythritol 4-phosphate cytidylyltransferase/2-C-methyl-D-erythritol 2,4-cyclodiphosphate synthase n=1 Tax=uncultured Methylobacterium sp. TaxID=157278 RepID=UPI0035CBF213